MQTHVGCMPTEQYRYQILWQFRVGTSLQWRKQNSFGTSKFPSISRSTPSSQYPEHPEVTTIPRFAFQDFSSPACFFLRLTYVGKPKQEKYVAYFLTILNFVKIVAYYKYSATYTVFLSFSGANVSSCSLLTFTTMLYCIWINLLPLMYLFCSYSASHPTPKIPKEFISKNGSSISLLPCALS